MVFMAQRARRSQQRYEIGLDHRNPGFRWGWLSIKGLVGVRFDERVAIQ
jgi:hypothetical protein